MFSNDPALVDVKNIVIYWPSSTKYIFKNTCLDLNHDLFNLFVIFISRVCHWIVQMDLFVLLFRQDVSKLIDWNEHCYYKYVFQNLSLFYQTMLFKYPSVLSRFCLPTKGLTAIISVLQNYRAGQRIYFTMICIQNKWIYILLHIIILIPLTNNILFVL